MSRRTFGSAALAAALLSTGILPLLGTAHADACASWTDPKGDATMRDTKQEVLADANMDILGVSFQTAGTKVVATLTIQDLVTGYSDSGDEFAASFKAAGTQVRFVAQRDEIGEYAKVAIIGGSTTGAATAEFDPNANTVTITATQAEVDKAAGKATAGVVATGLQATSSSTINGQATLSPYDGSLAPAGLTYTVGAQCSPALPAALPMPNGTCSDILDAPGDANPGTTSVPNDPDLDIASVAFNTTPTAFYTYVRVATLGAKPAYFQGDRFQVTLKAGTKTYTFAAGRVNVGKSIAASHTRGQVGTTTEPRLKVRGVFDRAKNTVVIVVDRASLNTVHGSPVADGTLATEVVVKSLAILGPAETTADTAQATDAAARKYTFGDSKCFPPPPGVLDVVGKTAAQYSDAAAVAARLTSAAGDALAGKTVTFSVGSRSVSATTNGGGIASASLNPGLAAGTYSLVAKFAGDGSAGAVTLSTPFTVTTEKTVLTLKISKKGSKRSVVATLKDDDGQPLGGQVVTWYLNGKKVSAPKTNAAGIVTLTTAKPTQTVKAVFAGVGGKYLGATAQGRV